MRLSETAKREIWKRRQAGVRQYKLAQAAQIHPVILSQMINDVWPIRQDDLRVNRLAGVLGLRIDECLVDDVGLNTRRASAW
jgi:hypothetical protein